MPAKCPSALIEQLTGTAPELLAQACDVQDLEAAQLLLDEALAIKMAHPRLWVVPALAVGG